MSSRLLSSVAQPSVFLASWAGCWGSGAPLLSTTSTVCSSALPALCRRLNSFHGTQPPLLALAFLWDILSLRGSRFGTSTAFPRGLLTMAWRSRGCGAAGQRCPSFGSSSDWGRPEGDLPKNGPVFPRSHAFRVRSGSWFPLKSILLPRLSTHAR